MSLRSRLESPGGTAPRQLTTKTGSSREPRADIRDRESVSSPLQERRARLVRGVRANARDGIDLAFRPVFAAAASAPRPAPRAARPASLTSRSVQLASSSSSQQRASLSRDVGSARAPQTRPRPRTWTRATRWTTSPSRSALVAPSGPRSTPSFARGRPHRLRGGREGHMTSLRRRHRGRPTPDRVRGIRPGGTVIRTPRRSQRPLHGPASQRGERWQGYFLCTRMA